MGNVSRYGSRNVALSSMRSLALVILFFVAPAPAVALHHLSNQLVIDLRTAQATQSGGLRNLTRSNRRSSLQETEDVDSLPRLQKKTAGRPASHLLVENTIAKQHLLQVQTKRDELAAENQRLQRDQRTMRHDLTDLRARLTAAQTAHQQLVTTIARLRILIPQRQALEEQHRSLLSQLVTLEHNLELLRVETNARRDDTNQDWAMVGIGVLLAGVLAGMLATRTRW